MMKLDRFHDEHYERRPEDMTGNYQKNGRNGRT
jgi:hypothetical protein